MIRDPRNPLPLPLFERISQLFLIPRLQLASLNEDMLQPGQFDGITYLFVRLSRDQCNELTLRIANQTWKVIAGPFVRTKESGAISKSGPFPAMLAVSSRTGRVAETPGTRTARSRIGESSEGPCSRLTLSTVLVFEKLALPRILSTRHTTSRRVCNLQGMQVSTTTRPM